MAAARARLHQSIKGPYPPRTTLCVEQLFPGMAAYVVCSCALGIARMLVLRNYFSEDIPLAPCALSPGR